MAFAQLTQVFYEPAAAFAALKERSHAWLPLLLTMALSIGITVWYFQSVDMAWLLDHSLPPDMPAEARTAAAGAMTRNSMLAMAVIGMLVALPLIYALTALYFKLAGKIANYQLSFGQGFALALWASLPSLLSIPLMALQIATGDGQIRLEDTDMLSLNFLLVHAVPFSPWAGIAQSFKLTNIWVIILTACGLQAWTGKRFGTGIVVAALPFVVIYGGWAAFIFFKH